MRKIKNFIYVAFLSLMLFPQIAKSQSKDSIEMRKSLFFQNGQILKAAEVVNIMKPYLAGNYGKISSQSKSRFSIKQKSRYLSR